MITSSLKNQLMVRNGLRWQKLMVMGNSEIKHEYATVDYSPYSELSYYRIKQVDYDGLFKFSPTISLEMNDLNRRGLFYFQILPMILS